MAVPDARPGEVNGDALDRFTFGHAAAGVLLGLAGAPFWWTLSLAVLWELAEDPLKDRLPLVFPNSTHDTVRNATVDVLACLAGWAAIRALPPMPKAKALAPAGPG